MGGSNHYSRRPLLWVPKQQMVTVTPLVPFTVIVNQMYCLPKYEDDERTNGRSLMDEQIKRMQQNNGMREITILEFMFSQNYVRRNRSK